MTTAEAKKIVQKFLDDRKLPYTKLTAKTSYIDRKDCIFVKVHGWKPNPAWTDLKNFAKGKGFYVESDGISS
jgi:hypothetical protein